MENNEMNINTNKKPKKNQTLVTVLIVAIVVVIAGFVFLGQDRSMERSVEIDTTGIHIMSDGSVMLGDGTALNGAIVMDDGMIKLPNGKMVTPAMDLREGGSTMEGMDM